jgi:ATP-dependent DNA ligase
MSAPHCPALNRSKAGTQARCDTSDMPLEIHVPLPPMEALSVEDIPEGKEWQYEPKWDGFRCLVFREG